jgi:prepilin-type N-terminal cleavage/methylation domain-containing protein
MTGVFMNKAGFSFIEVMVALLIVSSTFLTLFHLYGTYRISVNRALVKNRLANIEQKAYARYLQEALVNSEYPENFKEIIDEADVVINQEKTSNYPAFKNIKHGVVDHMIVTLNDRMPPLRQELVLIHFKAQQEQDKGKDEQKGV